MKRNLLRFATILFTVVISASFVYAQEGYNLQYKMQKGKTYKYRGLTNSKVTQQVMGREMTFNNDVHTIDRMIVTNRSDNGNLTLTAAYDSIKVHSSSSMKDTTFSLKDFLGKRTKMVLTKLGVVENKTLLDSLDNQSGIEKNFRNQSSFEFVQLPGKSINIGDKWQASKIDTADSQMGKMVIKSDFDYTLAGKEKKAGRDCLKITFTAKTNIEGKGNMRGMELYIEGTGKATGSADFDPEEGVLVNIDSKSDHKMTIAAKGNQNMIIPVTQSTNTSRTLISD